MQMRWLTALGLGLALVASSCGSDTEPELEQSVTTDQAVDPSQDNHDDGHDHSAGAVVSPEASDIEQSFDLLASDVRIDGADVVFRSVVVDAAGQAVPDAVGDLDGAPVWSYVWPTSLDSSTVGFGEAQGILALAATSHPDFDDTPLYDENGDGDNADDGALWHAHWVVLVEDATCGGGLTVKDIPDGDTPTLPSTWPELPILIDSPDLTTTLGADSVEIRVPAADLEGTTDFDFDGVTAGLRVSTTPHNPLLCVEAVFDVASGDLSLPGTVEQ